MAYNTEAGPTKYLVGTEQGTVLSINLRTKKDGIVVTMRVQGSTTGHLLHRAQPSAHQVLPHCGRLDGTGVG